MPFSTFLLAAMFRTPCLAADSAAPAPLLEVPRRTILAVELVDPVSSADNKTGETFRSRLNDGIWVGGRVAIPPGTTLIGRVEEAVPSGRIKGRARLAIRLITIELGGKSYDISTDTISYQGDRHTGKHIGSMLGGALQGALYGVMFGGKEGAVLGAGAGAGAGAATSVFKGKEDVSFAQGAKLLFETQKPVSVPEPPAAPPAPIVSTITAPAPLPAPAASTATAPGAQPDKAPTKPAAKPTI